MGYNEVMSPSPEHKRTDSLSPVERRVGNTQAFIDYLTALREALCQQSAEVSSAKILMVHEDRGQIALQRPDRLFTLVLENNRLGVGLSDEGGSWYYVELVGSSRVREKVWGELQKRVLGRSEPVTSWNWGILAELSHKIACTGGPFVISGDYPRDGSGKRGSGRVVVGKPAMNLWGDTVGTIDEDHLFLPHLLRRAIKREKPSQG